MPFCGYQSVVLENIDPNSSERVDRSRVEFYLLYLFLWHSTNNSKLQRGTKQTQHPQVTMGLKTHKDQMTRMLDTMLTPISHPAQRMPPFNLVEMSSRQLHILGRKISLNSDNLLTYNIFHRSIHIIPSWGQSCMTVASTVSRLGFCSTTYILIT